MFNRLKKKLIERPLKPMPQGVMECGRRPIHTGPKPTGPIQIAGPDRIAPKR